MSGSFRKSRYHFSEKPEADSNANFSEWLYLPLDAGRQVVMIITSWRVFVIFPMIHDLHASVDNSSGCETGSFEASTTEFAIYFHESDVQVVFTATRGTALQFFPYKFQHRWTNGLPPEPVLLMKCGMLIRLVAIGMIFSFLVSPITSRQLRAALTHKPIVII
jgi:hypothetical protein